MSTSRSRRPTPEAKAPPRRPRSYWPLVPLAAAIAAATLIAALPAAVLTHFLPARVRLADLSGTIWHGAAGRLSIEGRDAGAIEWRLHPLGLLHGALQLDVHWVALGMSVDGATRIDRGGLEARGIRGGGPIGDLARLGLTPGWSGTVKLSLASLETSLTRIDSITGDVRVSDLASTAIAGGADLGGYRATFSAASAADGTLAARVDDTGGPLQLRAKVTIDQSAHRGVISGTLAARPQAPAALAALVAQMADVRGRDALGRVPVDLEFTF